MATSKALAAWARWAVITAPRSPKAPGLSGPGPALLWQLAALLTFLALWPTATAQAAEPRFRIPANTTKPLLSPQVLTPEERDFLARLPELRVAVPQPSPRPYEDVAADGEVSGIHPEMLSALARTFGLKLRPVLLPGWSATLQAARDGQVDIVMTLGVTAERMDYLAFTLGATPMPGALFSRPGATPDLPSARFALERNFLANDWVRRQYPQAQVLTVETTGDALRAVAKGQADVYLGSLLETTDWLAREPMPGVELNRLLSYGTGYYHFGVRKGLAPLAAILNKGIQALRNDTPGFFGLDTGMLPSGAQLPRLLSLDKAEANLLAQHPVWRVGAVRGLPLLNDVDEHGLHSGVAAEYTEQVARRLGVAVQVLAFDSVAAMLDGLRKGDIDIVPFLTQTPSRSREFDFSAAYVEMPYMLVARSDAPQYWDLNSLRGKTLALAAQHPLREFLAVSYPEIRILEAEAGTGAMDLVVGGKADAAVEVKLFANLRLNAPDGERLRIVSEVQELPAQFHFATTKATRAMLPLVNRALADIDPADRQRMLRRWVAVDLKPAFPWQRYAPLAAVSLAALALLAFGTAWWMRRLKREVKARRRSEDLLSDIGATVPGLAFRYVLGPGQQLKHHFYTPGAKAFLGVDLDPKATILVTLGPAMVAEDLAAAQAEQARCLLNGEPFKVTCRYRHPSGRQLWLHTEAVQTRNEQGNAVWTGYVVDVSTERELQQRLAAEAESRNLMLASASHELRAPTHTLSLALQSLPLPGLSAEQRHAVQIAQDAARTLSELLDDVLDAARSGHDALHLRPRSFDLHQLLEDLARAWRSAARTKGLAFELRLAPGVPRTVQTDPLRLKQVLTNLLSNACKYTAQGSVSLQARCTADGALQLRVADTGIGIDPAAQATLFAPYVTLDDPRADPGAQHSTGLGLATTRRLATLLGGLIELHSQPGQGTQVSFTLPLPALGPQATASAGSIVVCDDDDTSRLLMVLMLRRQGFDIQDTASGADALKRWRSGGVSALVSDLDMPGMGGLDLIRTLRAEEQSAGKHTAVIVCSGSPVPGADGHAEQGLYDAYLVKPVDVSTLTDTLQRLGVVA